MPKRKAPYAAKRNTRRKRMSRRLRIKRGARPRAARPMHPRTYYFTRKDVQTIDLVAPGTATAANWYLVDNGMCCNRTFSLNQIPNNQEFTNLFTQYKICAIKQTFYFSNTDSPAAVEPNPAMGGTNQTLPNRQIIMYAVPNRSGSSSAQAALTEQFFMENSATKQRLCLNTNGKPVSLYTKLDQLTQVYGGVDQTVNPPKVLTDYVRSRPRFINSSEPDTPHVGLQYRFQRVDGEPFSTNSSNFPKLKIITKYYIQTRQVS